MTQYVECHKCRALYQVRKDPKTIICDYCRTTIQVSHNERLMKSTDQTYGVRQRVLTL
jgi:hypothetical protein